MAAALTLLMSLHARPQDRMSHVLASPPYDRNASFFSRRLTTRSRPRRSA